MKGKEGEKMLTGIIEFIDKEKGFGFIIDRNRDKLHFNTKEITGEMPSTGDSVIIGEKKKTERGYSALKIERYDILSEYKREVKKGYFLMDGSLREEFIIQYAKELAKILLAKKITPTQLRKYFESIVHCKSQFQFGKNKNAVKQKLITLLPLIAEAVGKSKIPNEFLEFYEVNLNVFKNDVYAFTAGFFEHFQAIYGWFKYYSPK